MSEESFPPQPTATWNPVRGVWETHQVNLLCGHLEPYSPAWPSSGTTRSGRAYAPATSVRATGVNASSSSHSPEQQLQAPLPGRTAEILFTTPTASLGRIGGSQHPNKRRAGKHSPNLSDQVEHLLPTPKASDVMKGSRNQRQGNGDMTLASATASLLPLWTVGPANEVTASALTRGDATPPPSPAGSGRPVPRHHLPTVEDGSRRASSNG